MRRADHVTTHLKPRIAQFGGLCGGGGPRQTLCQFELTGVPYNSTYDLSSIGNPNLSGAINATIFANMSGTLDITQIRLNMSLDITARISVQVACNGKCSLKRRRRVRGNLLLTDFHKSLRLSDGRPFPEASVFRVITEISVPWSASMDIVANTTLSYMQEYRLRSSLFAPGLSASTATPKVTVGKVEPVFSRAKARVAGRFIAKPKVFGRFTFPGLFVNNEFGTTAGFSLRSRATRRSFRAVNATTGLSGSCDQAHRWKGLLSPILGNSTGTYESGIFLGFNERTESLPNVAPEEPYQVCGAPAL